jgi:hypothetical protein
MEAMASPALAKRRAKRQRQKARRPTPPRENPAEQLRLRLGCWKERGEEFDEAWRQSLKQIVWPVNTQPRREWKTAITETREAWANCYQDQGVPLSLTTLIGALLHEYDLVDEDMPLAS